jgi:DNA repair protein RadD
MTDLFDALMAEELPPPVSSARDFSTSAPRPAPAPAVAVERAEPPASSDVPPPTPPSEAKTGPSVDFNNPSLRPYQRDLIVRFWGEIEAGRRKVLAVLPTGGGKCLGRGTPVLMFDGTIKPVELVVPGDLLMGPDSQPRRVSSTTDGWGPLYRVRPTKGEPWVCNDVHILSLVHTVSGEVIDIEAREYANKTKTFRREHKQFQPPNGVDFPVQCALPVDPYFIGLWLGDGTKALHGVGISKPDPEVLATCMDVAATWGCAVRTRISASGGCPTHTLVTLQERANPLLTAMRGIVSDGRPAEKLRTASREERKAILAGLIDSDGYVHHGHVEIAQKNTHIADLVAFIARSLGFKVTQSVKVVNGTDYQRMCLSGDFGDLPMRIPRKKMEARRQKKCATRTGITLEPIGDGEYFGFEIDGDRRFLLGDFTVTHNTHLCSEIIDQALQKGMRVLFLAHRRELISQASKTLHAAHLDHGIIQAGFSARMWEKLQVASIQTVHARAFRSSAIDLPEFDLIVIDEAHRSTARSYKDVVKAYPQAILLGLTATPCRGDGRGLGECFDVLLEGARVGELVEGGFLVPTRVFAPSVPDLKDVKVVRGDYAENQLAEKMDKAALIGDVVLHWIRLAEGRKTVVFATSVAHSMHLAQEFQRQGILAEHVDGSTPAEERDRINQRVVSGEIDVLCNCAVYTEGWDCPEVSCVILARPTKSIGLFRQMIGRALRPSPGKQNTIILDHAGAVFEHGFIDEDVEWSLKESHRAKNKKGEERKKQQAAKLVACPECAAINWQGRPCSACGWRPRPKPAPVAMGDGDLGEVTGRGKTKKAKKEAIKWDMQQFYGMLRSVAEARGYKPGWAYYKFLEKFPQAKPKRDWPAVDPSAELLAWVRSRSIARAKGLARG